MGKEKTAMMFTGFDGLRPDQITSEVAKAGEIFDLHNDWNLVTFTWYLSTRTFSLEWAHVSGSGRKCRLRFEGLFYVEMQPSERGYSIEDSQTVSELVYQEFDPAAPFVKFWFLDETLITVAAASATFEVEHTQTHGNGHTFDDHGVHQQT